MARNVQIDRTSPRRFLALLLLACACAAIALGGCAPKAPGPARRYQDPSQVWTTFLDRSAEGSTRSRGFRMKASLNLDTDEGSHRVVFLLWGNYDLPLRIDLTTGFGSPFSMWRVGSERLIAYYPGQQRAFVGPPSRRVSLMLGLETPFELPELAWLLTARFDKVLPSEFGSAKKSPAGGWVYRFRDFEAAGKAVLDRQGRIVALSGSRPYSWEIEFSRYTSSMGRPLPRRIALSRNGTRSALIRIKEAKLRRRSWDESSLQLRLPKDTIRVPLR
jgi:outer membrane biogenesis lipoprotein LolB